MSEPQPTTEAGRAALALVREPLIYGVRDRLDGNYAIAWAVRDGLIAAEAEAARAALEAAAARVEELPCLLSKQVGCTGGGAHHLARAAVLAAIRDQPRT
jgi:hypothetical protein